MSFAFNPLTGNFDQKGSGVGGASYIDGEVATYNDLPLDGSAALNSAWLVREASGVWPVSRKQAGIYIRTATAGSSRDADYTYAGTMPDVFSDSQFTLYDNSDSTKNLQFDLGNISTGTTRTLTVPDASGTIALNPMTAQGDLIVGGSSPAGVPTRLGIGSSGQQLRVGSSGGLEYFTPSAGISGGTGSTDNAILRADGTGGSTAQDSALVITDYTASTQGNVALQANVAGFSVTGVAATGVFTAVGHNFIANQMVQFTSLTGGSGLQTTRAYFVRDISGDTFKVSFASGTGAVNFTTDVTAGTIVPSAAIALIPQGLGGLMTAIPDGTSTNGGFRGYGAVDLCFSRTNSANVASGVLSAVLGGTNNRASNNNSATVGGLINIASGAESIVCGGTENTASGSRSACLGGNGLQSSGSLSTAIGGFQNRATAENALAFGRSALADRYSLMAHANIAFAAIGDSQRIRAVLRCKTTTDSAVEMALNGTTTYLTIPSGKVIFCNIKVVGVKSDGSAVATYERQYAAKNVAGTSSEVYAPVTIGTDNAASTSLAITTEDAGDYISIKPTGIASETWRWVASVDAVEVAYGG